jgi:photosystem II stability/assembly factor-like uncharacterized protein
MKVANSGSLISILVTFTFLLTSAIVSGQPAEPIVWTRTGGPLGGLGYDVRMRPDNPDIMYVTDAHSGAFRSTDGGRNWEPINEGIEKVGETGIPVFCLTIDPHDHDIVWLGLSEILGLYRSSDGGDTWEERVNGIEEKEGLTFRGITIDPRSSEIVYAAGEIASWAWSDSVIAGREFDLTKGVVYKTTDAGENWTAVWRGDNLARYVWINPMDPDIIYISTGIFDREAANSNYITNTPGGVGIVKSKDGGKNWEEINNGLTNLYIGTLYMHPHNPDILLAGASNNTYRDGSGVFLTRDGGSNWIKVLNYGVQSVEFAADPQFAYAGNPEAIFLSVDGGMEWEEVSLGDNTWGPPGIQAGFPIDFQVDPRDPGRMFTNNYGGGNFLTNDAGRNWTVASKGYTGAQVRAIAVSPVNAKIVYAAARSGVFLTQDGGDNWEGRNFPEASGLEWNVIAVDPDNDQHVLAANNWLGLILESRDGAESWRISSNEFPGGGVWRSITFTTDPNIIYAGTGGFISGGQFDGSVDANGIYTSRDGGQTWIEANDDLSRNAHVAALASPPHDPQTVYAAATKRGVLRTTDGGNSWTGLNTGLPPQVQTLAIAIDPNRPEHLFVGTEFSGLFQSKDGGISWHAVEAGIPAEARVTAIVYHPQDPEIMFLADFRSTVYRSTDGGTTWAKTGDGLKNRSVNGLAISNDGAMIYAATEGEGVFRAKLEEISTSIPSARQTGFSLQQNFPNPFQGATIIRYQLSKASPVVVRIMDLQGKEVIILVNENQTPGTYSISWTGIDSQGRYLTSGIYLCELLASGHSKTKKILLFR